MMVEPDLYAIYFTWSIADRHIHAVISPVIPFTRKYIQSVTVKTKVDIQNVLIPPENRSIY